MIIANPLYDTAFKQLARDPEIATAMIETLLETEVVEITLSESEHNKLMGADDKRPKFLRVDYCAMVRDKNGATQKILIEMQKGSGAENILRFREYLAIAGYLPKAEEKSPIPIVTVYFLGFNLTHVKTPCLKVARRYIDMMNNTVLDTKETFVELLTHDSYVIQTPRINFGGNPQTKLEKILSVFEQKNFLEQQEETLNYKYPIDDSAVKKMVDMLHYIGTDPDERKILDEEAYWLRHDDLTVGELVRSQDALAEKDRELTESKLREEAAIRREEEAKQYAEAAKQREEEAKRREEEAKRREEEAKQYAEEAKRREKELQRKLARKLMANKTPIHEIAELIGQSVEEIEKLKLCYPPN